jgi:hypothetical protein
LPATALSLFEIKAMVNEMLQQNRDYLPQFEHLEAWATAIVKAMSSGICVGVGSMTQIPRAHHSPASPFAACAICS